MRKLLMLLLCSLFLTVELIAQNRTITGKVTDAKGIPLSGVSVTVKGSTVGTATSIDGSFSLSVPSSATTLVFSSVNMTAKEVNISNQNSVLVSLQSSERNLQEVVVTALGIAKDKRSLGYATQTVKGSEIANKGELNVVNALQGRLAGVNITGASGGAGASTNINIRGIHSFTGNNQPLFVVDGIPISNNVDRTNGGPLGSIGDYQPPNRALDIDPNNIESINVLKGGAAAALYGSRAANGVIVITTKKGSGGRGRTDITLSSSYSIQKAYGLIELQNQYGQGTNGIFSAITGNSWGPKIGTTPTLANGLIVGGQPVPYVNYPHNVEDFFERGSVLDNNLTINTGDANQNFTFSIGNSKQIGIVPNTNFNRTSVRLGSNTTIREKLKVGGSVNFSSNTQLGAIGGNGSSSLGQLVNVTRTTDLLGYKTSGTYKNANGTNNWYVAGSDNPYFDAYENPVRSNLTRIIGNVNLGYDLASWVSINYKLGIDAYTDRRKQIFAVSSSRVPAGQTLEDIFYRSELTGQLTASFRKNNLFVNGINASLLLGQEINQRKFQNVSLQGDQLTIPGYYNINNATNLTNGSQETSFIRRLAGAFAQVSLSYNNYLFLELTGRGDKSSTLPKDKNTYFYPSASLSFVFTDAFKIQSDILSYGKIRASYAKVGNDAPPYQLQNFYAASTFGNNVAQLNLPITTGGVTLSGFSASSRIASADLSPEFTTSYEGGINLGLFKNRASIDVSYFKETSKAQIFNVSLAPSTGFATLTTNVGEMYNKGWEALVTVTPVSTRNFKWDVTANYTDIQNKVVSISPGITVSSLTGTGSVFAGTSGTNQFTGSIASIVEGQPYGVIVGSKYARSPDGQLLINPQTGLFSTTVAGQVLADPNPDFKVGVTNTLTYKIFTLSALIDYRKGGDIVSFSAGFAKSRGAWSQTAIDRDQPRIYPGVIFDAANNKYIPNYIQIPAQLYYQNLGLQNDFNVYDATVFRIREVSLGVNVPADLLKKLYLSGARFSVFGRNLFFKAPNSILDPEVNTAGAGNIQGLELQSAPNTRSLGVSLQLTF